MKKLVIGIFAHVDAGKTTLAEAMLYQTGKIRKLGRVDHGSTLMDTHELERERGITIFASQAVFTIGETDITLLDTPGHVDFSSETERMMSVLDYAVLVISATDGVQAHTRTLWRLLCHYNIPVFIFVTKMDFARCSREDLLKEIQEELSPQAVDFSDDKTAERFEALAVCREDILESYLESGTVSVSATAQLILARNIFPCFFGSGLKLEGIEDFLQALASYTLQPEYPESFGAKVFKISYDSQGSRMTHVKVTGGCMRVRESIRVGEKDEKISQLRIYSGAKFVQTDEVQAGNVCAVLGLSESKNGQGLGIEAAAAAPVLEPVMNFRIVLPSSCDAKIFMPKLRLLEEEDPQLHVSWNSRLQEIHVGLMGEVQAEILKSIILERFGVEVNIDSGRVLYKETIEDTVEGVGHYEPLRHYAEVHLLLEPLPRGSGIVIKTCCSEDLLDRNWQRLILTHIAEKQHVGVLTASPITDMKITLVSGRAHVKHTEGGDFRQATYRAVRQGLMQAKSILLEPYYSFKLEVPPEQVGRAINDIRMRSGTFSAPENMGAMSILKGKVPVTSMNGYLSELAAYTGGRGRLNLELAGYDICHDADAVIKSFNYKPEADVENTPDSVFCAHGGGYGVKWNEVSEYMHLESCIKTAEDELFIPSSAKEKTYSKIDDKELEAIMEREFGPIKRPQYSPVNSAPKENSLNRTSVRARTKYYIIDGYNVIFAWDELKSIAESDLAAARDSLMSILHNYSAFTKCNIVLVFDAYKVAGGAGKKFDYNNVHVVYTKENETSDMYIEKLASEIGKNEQVRVVSSDALIQLSVLRSGVMRLSSAEFEREVQSANIEISKIAKQTRETHMGNIGENIALKD